MAVTWVDHQAMVRPVFGWRRVASADPRSVLTEPSWSGRR